MKMGRILLNVDAQGHLVEKGFFLPLAVFNDKVFKSLLWSCLFMSVETNDHQPEKVLMKTNQHTIEKKNSPCLLIS